MAIPAEFSSAGPVAQSIDNRATPRSLGIRSTGAYPKIDIKKAAISRPSLYPGSHDSVRARLPPIAPFSKASVPAAQACRPATTPSPTSALPPTESY